MNIKFRTNSNSLFWHFVDSCSLWEYHVSKHNRKFLNENVNLSARDLQELDNYKKYRSVLGWDEESLLFHWAYEGFPTRKKYNDLYETIEYFKAKKLTKENQTLEEYFSKKVPMIKTFISKLNASNNYSDFDRIVNKVLEIFPLSDIKREVICYVAYSPYNQIRQNGANGDSLYVEVNEKTSADSDSSLISILIHEYIHNVDGVYKYLTTKLSTNDCKLFQTKLRRFHNEEGKIFDEMIAYSVSPAITHKTDIDERITFFLKKGDLESQRIWQGVKLMKPIIEGYLEDKITKEAAFEKLISTFKSESALV